MIFAFLGYMIGFLQSKQSKQFDLSREIFNKAQFEYKSGDYNNAIKYLEVANEIYKDYDISIAFVKNGSLLKNSRIETCSSSLQL